MELVKEDKNPEKKHNNGIKKNSQNMGRAEKCDLYQCDRQDIYIHAITAMVLGSFLLIYLQPSMPIIHM